MARQGFQLVKCCFGRQQTCFVTWRESERREERSKKIGEKRKENRRSSKEMRLCPLSPKSPAIGEAHIASDLKLWSKSQFKSVLKLFLRHVFQGFEAVQLK